jgi:hypothetical protein
LLHVSLGILQIGYPYLLPFFLEPDAKILLEVIEGYPVSKLVRSDFFVPDDGAFFI